MKLGIIATPDEASFQMAAAKGLDFLEFTINVQSEADKLAADNVKAFFDNRENLKLWIEKYHVKVGSIGRWGANRINLEGNIILEEMQDMKTLVDVAEFIGCESVVCGINYVNDLSFYENCAAAISFLSELAEYAKSKGIKLSVYNCRWNNFICEPIAWKVVLGHVKDVGIKFDPSHCIYAEGDYLKEMRDWGHRFNHVHIKGSLVIDGKRFDDPPAGLDQTNWGAFMSVLYALKYEGGLSIEPHSSNWRGELGDWGVDYTVRYMKQLLF